MVSLSLLEPKSDCEECSTLARSPYGDADPFLDSPRKTVATAQNLYHRFHLFFPRKDFGYQVQQLPVGF